MHWRNIVRKLFGRGSVPSSWSRGVAGGAPAYFWHQLATRRRSGSAACLATWHPPLKPTACDIAIRSLYTSHTMCRGTSSATSTATPADAEKLRTLEHAVRRSLSPPDATAIPGLGFNFESLVVDKLGAPSERVVATIKQHVRQILM